GNKPIMRRTTQKDIAEALGVGRSTVSMALRDDPRISPALRERVRKAAKRLDYVPDPALAALAAYRETHAPRPVSGNRLAFLYDRSWGPREPDRKFPLIQGVHDRAAELGYQLEMHATRFTESELRSTLRICKARGIEGLVLNLPGT